MKKKYTPKEARQILAQLNASRSTLYLSGMITEAENGRIHDRIIKWRDKHKVMITDAQLDSVEFTYNDEAK